jgi:hypothetical protein
MRKYWIACLLPVVAIVVFSAGPGRKHTGKERISPAQKSMKLYDMEQQQDEMNRAMDRFRPNEMD